MVAAFTGQLPIDRGDLGSPVTTVGNGPALPGGTGDSHRPAGSPGHFAGVPVPSGSSRAASS